MITRDPIKLFYCMCAIAVQGSQGAQHLFPASRHLQFCNPRLSVNYHVTSIPGNKDLPQEQYSQYDSTWISLPNLRPNHANEQRAENVHLSCMQAPSPTVLIPEAWSVPLANKNSFKSLSIQSPKHHSTPPTPSPTLPSLSKTPLHNPLLSLNNPPPLHTEQTAPPFSTNTLHHASSVKSPLHAITKLFPFSPPPPPALLQPPTISLRHSFNSVHRRRR